jgi:AcrR family transcriptional regulator
MVYTMSSKRRNLKQQLDTMSSQHGDPATRQRICDSALRLISKQGGAGVTLAKVARIARVSRQALYLHFADRADLFVALVRYADERRGLANAIQRIEQAPSGILALREMAAMQARMNPTIWPLARLIDSVRRQDEAAERCWQDRLASRLQGCRSIVARLKKENSLEPSLHGAVATDLLWTLTSLRTWEDLVLLRGWTARQYKDRLSELLLRMLVRADARREQGTRHVSVDKIRHDADQ